MTDTKEPDNNDKRIFPDSVSDAEDGNSSHGFNKINFKANTPIFDEGDVGDAAYLILKGSVEIRKGVRASSPQLLATLGKGDAFGEMALFDDGPRMAQAIARTDVIAIQISRDEFVKRLDSIDPIMRTTVLYMVKRVRDMTNEFMRRKNTDWHDWRKDDKPPYIR